MKHKTWFRLALKGIGIYMICTAIPSILAYTSSLALQYSQMNSQVITGWSSAQQWLWMIPQALDWGSRIAIGLYLVLGGNWIVNKVIPSNRPYCPECGYELSHNASSMKCPECGVALPDAARTSSDIAHS
jgi:hypothetical protein